MERIGELVRNLVVVIFVGALLEMLIPQGSFSRYLRLVIGLLIILLVITFIGTLVNRLPGELSFFSETAAAGEQSRVQDRGLELWQVNRQQTLDIYRSAVTKLIGEEIRSHKKWALAQVDLQLEEDQTDPRFGSIYRAIIKITPAAETAASAEGNVWIEPVKIGSSDKAGGEGGGGGRVLELESALAQRLQLPPEMIEVWEIDTRSP